MPRCSYVVQFVTQTLAYLSLLYPMKHIQPAAAFSLKSCEPLNLPKFIYKRNVFAYNTFTQKNIS